MIGYQLFPSQSLYSLPTMRTILGPTWVLMISCMFVMLVFLASPVEATQENCMELTLPSWIDWRKPEAKNGTKRERLTEDPVRTSMVVIGAILTVLANVTLCHLLYSDNSFWEQRTYRMIFSLACNDCITGVLLGIAVLTEMKAVQDYVGDSNILCKIVIAGLWLCVVTSVYTFTVISVARWLMLNHPKYYMANFDKKPMSAIYIVIACCWILGAAHAIPLLTPWNDECVTDFDTCSLPYKSPLWIWGTAIFVLFFPSLVIVVVYTLILLKMRDKQENLLTWQVTKTMSILTAAFLICWWPLGIYLSVRWNSVGGSRGFYLGAISSFANPVLLIWLNNQLYTKVVLMFSKLKCW